MTSGFFSSNGGQRGWQTQEGRVTRVLGVPELGGAFMIPLLYFRKLLMHVHLVKKRLVKHDVKRTNRLRKERERPVCLRQHVFLQR